ncbi:hypothetical protein B0H13DRAFT_1625179 [Mycena leptocephala]|nr:hypothetical protein B0H13DRAFT_1625179 [Mycena leptocephala]
MRDSVGSYPFGVRETHQSIYQDHPLREWVRENREIFLVELLRGEGRGDHWHYSVCPACAVSAALYRCKTCVGGDELLCQGCIVDRHAQSPFHLIEYWTGDMFQKKTLKDMGLRIQLGHWTPGNSRCAAPEPAPGDAFVIVNDSGIHEVSLDFCGCGGGSKARQLLRARLYPATGASPRTAATFSVLRRFHLLLLESKCSAYEFYHSLARGTNNTGLEPQVKDRYHEFLRMSREWRNLQMLKRAARGHDPTGAAGTGSGECALLCPACPQPGKNLPEHWKDVPEDRRFLYALFLAMDANFRLKRKDVSSEDADPGLATGWAFFCEVSAYMAHLAENWDEPQERSTCVAHDAVDKPDREVRGTASSGIGAVDCARHNMKRPNAVGDLQLGERYINMDYMFFRSLAGTDLVRFFVSYDIACQWHKNIAVHMEKYSPEIRLLPEGKFLTFLVPKFHLPAHIEACNLLYSFNLTPHVGQTDGEAPERGWANANPLATSTKEMGPGARRDALDDHFNDWNYKKILALGRSFLKKVKEAVPQMVERGVALAGTEASMKAASGDKESPVVAWTIMAESWEEDPEMKNPFETTNKNDHLAQVRHDLAVEAAAREVTGDGLEGMVREGMHLTEMISMGLQLEEQQRILGFDVAATGLHPTTKQRTAMVERTSKLRRQIVSWIDAQQGFFPAAKVLRDRDDVARARIARMQPVPGLQVHDIRLYLPSEMMKQPGARHATTPLQMDALDHEYRLRVGQANEALDEVRRLLLVRTHLYQDKDANARGVRENMRSNDKIDVIDEWLRRMAEQYRAARRALVILGPAVAKMEWEATLRPLKATDVRGMPRSTFADPERQREEDAMSWIWVVQVDPANPAAVNEALRIEWAKTRARAFRWSEEVDLLEEEMHRTQWFLMWRSEWWLARADGRAREDGPEREGERAYAIRQAKLQADLCSRFTKMWVELPELIRKGREELVSGAAAAAAAYERRGDEGEEEESEEEGSEESEDDVEDDEAAQPVPAVSATPIEPLYHLD